MYSRGIVKTEIYSTLGGSLKALLSRVLKEEVFSAEEIPPGRQNSLNKDPEEKHRRKCSNL